MPERLVALLLQEWREAERELEQLGADAITRADVQRRVDSLRTAYHEAARVLQELHALSGVPRPPRSSVEGDPDRA